LRAYALVIVLLIAIFGSIAGYRAFLASAMSDQDFAPPPVTVAAAVVRQETQKTYLDAVGTIRAIRGIDLSSESSGQITELHFDSGDSVVAGQLLIVLNDEIEQASRRNQIASRELARIVLDRDRKLIDQSSIAQSRLDESKAALERAGAQLAETEARLRNKRIHAPFAGTLGIRRVELGDYLSPGTLIASLQDRSALEIDFTVPARFAPKLRVGQGITFGVKAFEGRSFVGKLAAIDTRADPGTRNLLLRAQIAEPDGVIPGMFASLRLDLGIDQSVITAPETAVTYTLQGNVIYVIEAGEDGGLLAVSRIVEVGEVRDGRVAILNGLRVGERVVTVGQNKLYRGVGVVIDESVEL